MKPIKIIITLLLTLILCFSFTALTASAATHTVKSGDTLWKISRSNGISLEELISANPQIKNPNLIYPGDSVYVPEKTSTPAREVLMYTNQNRSRAGIGALTLDQSLCKAAQAKADDMAAKGYFSHQSPTYGTPAQLLNAFGISYRYMGENIAKGYLSAEAVCQGWMNSEGHRANILNKNFTRLGVGYNAASKVWVQLFT